MDKFRETGLIEEILAVLKELKFEKPSEIQEKAIPFVIGGKDVIAGAATGSGKTLAFASGIIKNCEKIGKIQALVLVPTRELAVQVAKNLRTFSKNKPLHIAEVFGGVSMGGQISELEKADVVVGTPGRILDHISQKTIYLSNVKILVLDEADRMLDMGFIEDVDLIISNCPKNRQTLLFSATINQDISILSKKYLKEPVEVSAEDKVDPSKLTQVFYDVPDNIKFSLLVHLLKNEPAGLVMVFCNTQRNTDFVARNLISQGIDAVAIHGGLSQNKRTNIMAKFHANRIGVLVCTDVAARGLDIKGVSHVYNYDIPNEPNQYIHRIGRTARAGKEGKAINILASRDYENFRNVVQYHDINITKLDLPKVEQVYIRFDKHGGRDGGLGGRSFRGPRDGRRSFSGGRGERRGRGLGGRSGNRQSNGRREGGRDGRRRGERRNFGRRY